MKKRVFAFLGIFIFITSGVFSEDTLTIQSLVQEALLKSPAVRSKKAQYEALRSKVIKAWLPEDPMVSAEPENQKKLFDFGSRTHVEYMVSQTIPFPTKLFLNGIIASKEADMAYQMFKEEERAVAWRIEQPSYQLILSKRTVSALGENKALLEQLSNVSKSRYESNATSQSDTLKVQIELAQN